MSNRYRNRDTSSLSSIDSREDVKQIKKVTVSDTGARKTGSPISRKQIVATKFSENNESDDTVMQQEDSMISLKNNKSVLKSVSGSAGSLVKKKVLFDLEDGEDGEDDDSVAALENDQRKIQRNNSDWNISRY
jgi:phosphopantothenoylcysteine synthetase/decarboxylase